MLMTPSLSIAYLAAPFSHPDPAVKKQRVEQTTAFAAHLFNQGVFVFSPLIYCVSLVEAGTKTGWDTWEKYDLEMLSRCDKLIVLKLPGWENSIGVQAEIEHAKILSIPIEEMDLPPTS